MSHQEQTCLTISWSKSIDADLRAYLEARGRTDGDLSQFIEDAVSRHLFELTVSAIQDRNKDTDPREIQDLIDRTVREVRAERAARRLSDIQSSALASVWDNPEDEAWNNV